MSCAWLFPGHGSQYAGMGRELLECWPRARALFALAERLSGLPLSWLALRGDEERLRRPEILEPTLTALSLAHAHRAWVVEGPPGFVAGYSAGELAALCSAGALTEEDALRISVLRGRILQRTADTLDGRMTTVSDLPSAVLREVLATTGPAEELALAGENAPNHHTVSGRTALVHRVEVRAVALGARVSPIGAAGPWHCPLLGDAVAQLHESLKDIPFLAPRLPVYLSSKGDTEEDPLRLRYWLAEQLRAPVRWLSVVHQLLPRASRLLELGPGHTLIGFVRRVLGPSRSHELRAVERSGGRLSMGNPRRMNHLPMGRASRATRSKQHE